MNHISVKPQAIIINGQQYNHYNNMNHISVNTQTIIINGQQYNQLQQYEPHLCQTSNNNN
jgi:hypothetical protein